MKKILISLVLLAVVIGVGYYVFKHRSAEPAEAAAEAPAAKVETVVMAEQPIAQTVELFGAVTAGPSGDQAIPAPFDVVVRKVHVGVGTSVAAGDVLLEVDPSPSARLATESATSVRELAVKILAATQERYDLRLATRQELQSAQQAADDAKFKAEGFSVRGLGSDGRVTAPTAGVVSKLDLVTGAQVSAGTVLITVSTGGQLEARLGVEAIDAANVTPGQSVELESASRSESEKVAGVVRSVGAALDPTTGAAEVRVPIPAAAPLFLGEHVRAQVEVKRKDRALAVPRSAVLPAEGKYVLFTVKGGKAVKHEVKLGLVTDERVEVLGEDLHPGDVVVTLGNYELEDGMAVQAPEKEEKKEETKAAAKPAPEAKP